MSVGSGGAQIVCSDLVRVDNANNKAGYGREAKAVAFATAL
jgi:hypothetical protein